MMRWFFIILVIAFLSVSVSAQEWTSLESGIDQSLHAIEIRSGLVGWAVGGPGIGFVDSQPTMLKTEDSGDTWTETPVPGSIDPSVVLEDICFGSPNTGWAVGWLGTILRTTNGGDSWSVQESPTNTASLHSIWCFDENTAVATGNAGFSLEDGWFGTIIKTTNGGATWVSVLPENRKALHEVYFEDNVGYAVGLDSTVFKSTSTGDSWTEVTRVIPDSGIAIGLRDVFCIDENTCWVTGATQIIYKTEDGGDSWTGHSTGGAVASIEASFWNDDEEGWAVGQNVIRYTNTSGEEWEIQHTDISWDNGHLPINLVRDIQCRSGACWAVGDEGTILRLGEPDIYYVTPANLTVIIETPDTPKKEVPADCIPVTDDCEAGWNPVYDYDEEGCVSGYVCVREGKSINTKSLSEKNLKDISEFLARIPGIGDNERINLFIQDEIIGVMISNGKLRMFSGELEDGTYSLTISQDTLNDILESEDPADTAIVAIKSGEIKIEAHTFTRRIKAQLAKVALFFYNSDK
jgi:photosystem II stability/assembly factor-like uncharacterized protein